jgi:signal transduction histidine kinase
MPASKREERVLIVAPFGQDAAAMGSLLNRRGLPARICSAAAEASRQVAAGAGTLLLTEEALELPQAPDLLESLKAQPPWSELPLIILTHGGPSRLTKALDQIATAAGSVTLLERPLGEATLLHCVEVALHSRRRQYQLRDVLEEQERRRRELEQAQIILRQSEERLERTVSERTAELRAANEQLEAIIYSIAHDLRAPLRSMAGYSQLLVEDYAAGLAEAPQTLLRRIQTSSEYMDKLLLDLLAYGRMARAEIKLGPVELRQAWETALFQCATQIEQTQARIRAIEPLPIVRAHDVTLGQCLANLLGNALKFVAPGTRPRIRFWAEECGDAVRVWVEDNGIGIAPDQQERVFRIFERVHGIRYPGTGIGLSIVRKGIERMGGRVGVESEPGKGSRFWIELPKANPADLNGATA